MLVPSNLSFIFHHTQAMFFVLWHFCICRITTVGGVLGVKHVRSICVLHQRPERADSGYPPSSPMTASCYMCTAITWTSTDTSTLSTASFIIVKFINTAFSKIIMNERKNVDDKRNRIYSSYESCLFICLSLSLFHTSHTLLLSLNYNNNDIMRPELYFTPNDRVRVKYFGMFVCLNWYSSYGSEFFAPLPYFL